MAKLKILKIDVEPRSVAGTSASRRLRRTGKVPAILYGRGSDTTPLTLSGDAAHVVMHHPGMMNLNIEGGTSASVIVKNMQQHPITRKLLHVDFLTVKADEVIRSTVVLHPHGEPAGLAHGGQLEQALHELEIECLPADLPEFVEVDVSGLEVDQTMHVRDLELPDGIKAISDASLPAFQVRLPRVDESEEEEEDAEEGEGAEEGAEEGAAATAAGTEDS